MFANKKRSMMIWLILFVISAVFYLIWYWHDGVIMSVDGPTYISMESGREPAYPVFLWIFRTIVGENMYLDVVVIVQCLIAGLAAVAFAKSMQERFQLNSIWVVSILFIEYGITLLNRFVAQRRYSYYNSICSEALAYSFWIFFFISLLRVVYDKEKKAIVTSLIWCIVLSSIRKQMLISFCLLFIALIYIWWKRKGVSKTFIFSLVIVLLGFAGTRAIDRVYNYELRGEFAPHTGDSSFILGNEIYVADFDMVDCFESEEYKQIFLEILRRADEKQYNISYAGKGWMSLEDHYSDSYDRIKFNTTMVVIREYLQGKGIPDEQFNEYYEVIANEMTKALMIPCIPGMLKVFSVNVIAGFITSVLKVHRILNWGALLIYIAYLALLIYLIKKKASSVPLAIFTLLAIIINVCFTALTIYCQMRYMLYNTAFFYQSGVIMLIEAYRLNKKKV